VAANKHLGKGLDLLLSAGSSKPANQKEEKMDTVYTERTFSQALKADEEGNLFEAYYLYRTLVDYVEARLPADAKGASLLASQALNNAAIILHEAGQMRTAGEFLERACQLNPGNEVARENLKLIGQ